MPPSCSHACSVLRSIARAHPTVQPRHISTTSRYFASSKQTGPLQGYVADLLDAPLHSVQPATQTSPAPPPAEELPKTEKEETLAKARVVFGSRLAGPVERREQINRASKTIAGVLVPPKPEEPDNCCMSGCVNCVWDLYRDEMEEYAMMAAEARRRMTEGRIKGQATGLMTDTGAPRHVATSMDDDGGGSETNWEAGEMDVMEDQGDEALEDLFKSVPVGIRAFMETEKKLKQKHSKAGNAEAIAS